MTPVILTHFLSSNKINHLLDLNSPQVIFVNPYPYISMKYGYTACIDLDIEDTENNVLCLDYNTEGNFILVFARRLLLN